MLEHYNPDSFVAFLFPDFSLLKKPLIHWTFQSEQFKRQLPNLCEASPFFSRGGVTVVLGCKSVKMGKCFF